MGTAQDIIKAIQAVADSESGDNPQVTAQLGTTGNTILLSMPDVSYSAGGSNVTDSQDPIAAPTGQGWQNPSAWRAVVKGLAVWLDDQTETREIRQKLNEVIVNYNQLLDDHNNGQIPSSANAVQPLDE